MPKSAIYLVAVVTCTVGIGAGPPTESKSISEKQIGKEIVLVGRLGLPIGKEVLIQGSKVKNGPFQNVFFVETLDGKPKRTSLEVMGINDWPVNTRAALRGYEVGTVRFLHPRETSVARGDEFEPYQRLFLSFKVVEVIEPKGLQLNDGLR